DGLYLPSMEELREESNLRLEDALQPVIVPVLQGSETIADAARSFAQYQDSKAAPVVLIHASDGLWYAAKREELETLFSEITTANAGEARDAISADNSTLTLEEWQWLFRSEEHTSELQSPY